MVLTIALWSLLLWIYSLHASVTIAESKRNSGGWAAFAALMFGPLAVLLEAHRPINRQAVVGGRDSVYSVCPSCAEIIRREAVRCRHCGIQVEPRPLAVASRQPAARTLEEQARIDHLSRRAAIAFAILLGIGLLAAVISGPIWSWAEHAAQINGYRLLPPSEWF